MDATAPNSGWTEERVAELVKLRAEGWSFGQLAMRLHITRSAVCGKLDRLNGYRPRKPTQSVLRIRRLKIDGAPRDADGITDLPDEHIPVEQRCTIAELTEGRCRWPCGDPKSPDFFYCGATSPDDKPYCGYHARIAYQPPRGPVSMWGAR